MRPTPTCEAPLDVLVEIRRGSRDKWEFDEARGGFELDRVLVPPARYPVAYGAVLGTRAGDGDALDVLLVTDQPVARGDRIHACPIGVLRMRDEHGDDPKLLAIPLDDWQASPVRDVRDLDPARLQEIEAFFRTYKVPGEQAGEWTQVVGWEGAAAAQRALRDARARFARASTAPASAR